MYKESGVSLRVVHSYLFEAEEHISPITMDVSISISLEAINKCWIFNYFDSVSIRNFS